MARGERARWAIVQDDALVGRVGFRAINLGEGFAEIAYWTVPAARGRNIAARAVRTVSTWMFRSVGIHRLELSHSAGNSASCRVAEKAGYIYEGTRRQQALHQDGWHDMHLHARLSDQEVRE
jgi:RimJ/RimL family protein N-acetyltransferase